MQCTADECERVISTEYTARQHADTQVDAQAYVAGYSLLIVHTCRALQSLHTHRKTRQSSDCRVRDIRWAMCVQVQCKHIIDATCKLCFFTVFRDVRCMSATRTCYNLKIQNYIALACIWMWRKFTRNEKVQFQWPSWSHAAAPELSHFFPRLIDINHYSLSVSKMSWARNGS